MKKLMYITALGCLFATMQSGDFIAFVMASLFAYVLIEAAFTMDGKDEKED